MKGKKILSVVTTVVVIVLGILCCVACIDDDEKENNYDVEGIWHAVAAWQEEKTFTLLGKTTTIIDDYKVDFYFDFRADGSVLKKSVMSINDYVIHTDNEEWNIFNVTWSVKGNVITLSSGKQYVIVDDEFDDVFPAKNILLRYKKEAVDDATSAQKHLGKIAAL